MASEALPSHFLELVQDALVKVFWRKAALRRFLSRCGIKESALATWAEGESKREFLFRLFPRLEATDAGNRVIRRMAAEIAEMSSFPDLEGWEDSTQKKEAALRSVSALRDYLSQKEQAKENLRQQRQARERYRKQQEERRAEAQSLEKFSARLTELSTNMGSQRAGYDFQDWFYDLMEFFEIVSRRPYTTGGRQIDGSVTVDGTTYLVELKFTGGQADVTEIDSFLAKVRTKADNTMGIMVSMSGYSSVAINQASVPRTPVLLLDAGHVYSVLSGMHSFPEVVNRLRRHASQTGQAYLPVSEFSA